jgi:hypothetical protein
MGNRGCLHDAEQRIRRPWALQRWIHCVLQFKGRRRAVMTPGRYTELFFLDEATALAAGHRPCAECQRERYGQFREQWAAARGMAGVPSADVIDAVLHHERLGAGTAKRTFLADLSELPRGAMVAGSEAPAYLVLGDLVREWTPAGYRPAARTSLPARVRVLTPRSIVDTLARGYVVGLHPSAGA